MDKKSHVFRYKIVTEDGVEFHVDEVYIKNGILWFLVDKDSSLIGISPCGVTIYDLF